MYKNFDYIYDAIVKFEDLTALKVEIDSSRKEYDAILNIGDSQFTVIGKTEIRTSNRGVVISKINEISQKSKRPIIVVAKFITSDISLEFKKTGINYIDTAGNAFIKQNGLYIYIKGQKATLFEKTKQSRAFQEAGIKLIYNLLVKPENLELPYRKLAEITGIAVGTVSNVMGELVDLNFLLVTDGTRMLKNTKKLLERWMIAYYDVLRPRLLKKRMKFINPEK